MDPDTTCAARGISALVAIALSLTACEVVNPKGLGTSSQTASDQSAAAPEPTAAQKRFRSDTESYEKIAMGGILVGAGIGAAIGALSCLAVKKKDQSKCAVQRFLIGGAIGGIAGAVDGYMTLKRQEATDRRVREIDVVTEDVRRDNEKSQALVASSTQMLAESKSRLSQLEANKASGKVTVAQANAERAQIEADRDRLKASVDKMRSSRGVYQQTAAQIQAPPQSKRDLDGELKKLDTEIAALEQNLLELNKALTVSKA